MSSTYIAVWIDGEHMTPVGIGDSPEAALDDSRPWWRETNRLEIVAIDSAEKAAEDRARLESAANADGVRPAAWAREAILARLDQDI